MTVTWEDLGWERLAAGVGRCRLPGWDCTAGLVVGDGRGARDRRGVEPGRGRAVARAGADARRSPCDASRADPPAFRPCLRRGGVRRARRSTARWAWTRCLRARDARGAARGRGRQRPGPAPAAGGGGRAGPARATRSPASGRSTWAAAARCCWRTWAPGTPRHDLAVLVPGDPEVVFCGDLVEESGEPQAGPRRRAVALARRPGPAARPGRRGRAVRARSRSGGGRGVRPGANGTRWQRVSACRGDRDRRLLLSSSECASTPPT